MFLDASHQFGSIFPKYMCRYSSSSSKEYLNLLNRDIVNGSTTLLHVNDDAAIDALLKGGKTLSDARNYISAGCWNFNIESCEKNPDGEYLSLLKVLEMSVHNQRELMEQTGIFFKPIDGVRDFEELYGITLDNIFHLIRTKCNILKEGGKYYALINPSPLFSAGLKGCINNRKDYTCGGMKYNQGQIQFVGFANLIDSLLAIKRVCFDEKLFSLDDVLVAVRNNWEGYGHIRQEILKSPYFGDETPQSDAIAKRVHDELYERTKEFKTTWGGTFDIAYLGYTEVLNWGKKTLATPDGRYAGDYITQGVVPSRLHSGGANAVINSAGKLDLTKCAGSSVLTVVLNKNDMSLETLEYFLRAAAVKKLQVLQVNCLTKEDLLAAQINPENYQHLIVRICGFSAKFTVLSKQWQDEIISRNFYS